MAGFKTTEYPIEFPTYGMPIATVQNDYSASEAGYTVMRSTNTFNKSSFKFYTRNSNPDTGCCWLALGY